MINKKKKVIESFLVFLVFTIMLCSLVNAVGVASGYSANTPLELYPGEERTILLTLQNTDSEEEVVVEGKILEGSEIVSLDKSTFDVPYQSIEVSARMTVKVPADAVVGDSYTIRYEFNPVAVEGDIEGTGASVSQGVTRTFNVNVVEKPAGTEEDVGAIWWVLGIIVIVALIVIIYFVNKSKS